MNPPYITTVQAVDKAFYYIIGISVFFLLLITAIMVYFAWKYHRSRHPRPTSQVSKNVPLEVLWTVIPTLLAFSMFYYGWAGYITLQQVPEGALEVSVTARMWSWHFEYENGRTSDKLYVPTGKPVNVQITSADVIHSFFIPAFRVKKDAVPGMPTHVWFVAEQPGSYDLFCAEYCGVGHSAMVTTVEALPPAEFAEWYEKAAPAGARGELQALLGKHGCLGCHSLDGSPSVGPTLQGLFGRQVTVVAEGEERTVTADREYIRRSILEPQAELVQGFQPVMPSYQGQIPDQELEQLLDLLQDVEEKETPEEEAAEGEAGGEAVASGEQLAQEKGCIGCHSTDGSPQVGPTFQGLYGKQVTVERDGRTVTVEADEAYLRESINAPNAAIVQGFPPAMPDLPLSDAEVSALIEYIEGLR